MLMLITRTNTMGYTVHEYTLWVKGMHRLLRSSIVFGCKLDKVGIFRSSFLDIFLSLNFT